MSSLRASGLVGIRASATREEGVVNATQASLRVEEETLEAVISQRTCAQG